MLNVPTNAEKAAVWKAYHERRPTRVPLRWNVNSRILLLNPDLNPEGIGYREYFHEAEVTLRVQARFQEYIATVLSQVSDASSELPKAWGFHVETQNVYDAAYFGATVEYQPGQVPGTHQFLTLDDVDAFLARDFSRPLENPWLRERLAFRERLVAAATGFEYLGRRGPVAPFQIGFDGPVTVATNLFGSDIFLLLALDPPKAQRLLFHIARACALRNRALGELAGGWQKGDWGWTADDSIQLISTETYVDVVLPVHEFWYRENSTTTPASRRRFIHLCGDATRHFPTLVERLGVVSFDTGFPVDHGRLRRELGPEIEISGGPHVGLLRDGSPEVCAARTREILQSGIMAGGRFILQEANNLPPCVPLRNLEAVYATCLEYGRYPAAPGPR